MPFSFSTPVPQALDDQTKSLVRVKVRRYVLVVKFIARAIVADRRFHTAGSGRYVNTPFLFHGSILLVHTTVRRKANLSTRRVLIETLMNRSALFGDRLYRRDVGYIRVRLMLAEAGENGRRRLLGLWWSTYSRAFRGKGKEGGREGWDLRYGGRMVWHGHEYFASALIYAILCAGSFTAAPSPPLSLSLSFSQPSPRYPG